MTPDKNGYLYDTVSTANKLIRRKTDQESRQQRHAYIITLIQSGETVLMIAPYAIRLNDARVIDAYIEKGAEFLAEALVMEK